LPLAFVLLLLVLPVLHRSPDSRAKALEDLTSREGLLLLVAWLLLAIAFIILIATMWPVIIAALGGIAEYLPAALAARIPDKPMGLEPAFYNRTCLPLFALFAVLLLICPWRKWIIREGAGGFFRPRLLLAVLSAAAATAAVLWYSGIQRPIALLAAACSLAALMGLVLLFGGNRALFRVRSTLAAHGVHFGLLLMILGVAFSGPYQQQFTLELVRRQPAAVGKYRVMLNELYEGESQIGPGGKPNYQFVEAELLVSGADGAVIGRLSPQRRLYTNFEQQVYAEVDTIFNLGNEIYSTLLGVDKNGKATLAVNVNPLINWLWIGGTLMCLFPFLGLKRVRREDDEA
jgi:cytochrome c-type biogenesis protein CcmF